MKKRVLIFSVAYPPFVGGAELAIKEETDRINDCIFDMITLRFDRSLPKFERVGNINVYRIGFTTSQDANIRRFKFPLKLNNYLFPFIAFKKACYLHRKNRYDTIWAMMAAYAGFAALFFKMKNPDVKYLLTLQEGDPIDYIKKKVSFFYPLFRRIFTRADCIQTISHYLADFARAMGYKGEVRVIPNAVDIAHFSQKYEEDELVALKQKLRKEENDIFLIHAGRFVLKNAMDDLIKSLTFLPQKVKLLLLGTGPDQDKLEKLVEENKLSDRVVFYGFVDHFELPKFLQISDIFIRPSLSEGLGNSFLEAMAARIPVIATPVGGIPDFLYDPDQNPSQKPTGLFCEVRNPESIARQVQRFVDNPREREEIVQNAYEMVLSQYDWDIVSRDINKIFNEI